MAGLIGCPMEHIRAIGFDLFNTLITAHDGALDEAFRRLAMSLEESGLALEREGFRQAYREAAVRFIEETRKEGLETHNRFWISAALRTQGYTVGPDDAMIAQAVEHYFSAFFEYCHPIPGTLEMLKTLKDQYPLGLLSNFTHGPAARGIIEHLGLASFFDVILISGELGYCKPHPSVFDRLAEDMRVEKSRLIYIGDEPVLDVQGAMQAGIQPVWTTIVVDKKIPYTPGPPQGQTQFPEDAIPRISSWDEFLSLLKSK
ncbi:MAG: HAD family hydrolase [Desulfobacteraceae bacterium]|nr:HAD family hydrolase [Desulfobacteraceae bacterium]